MMDDGGTYEAVIKRHVGRVRRCGGGIVEPAARPVETGPEALTATLQVFGWISMCFVSFS